MTPRRPPIPAFDDLPGSTPDISSRLEPLRSPIPPESLPEAGSARAAAIRAGQAAARARGVRFGRPRTWDAAVAREVREHAADGTSLRGLAELFGLSVGAVRRILVTEGEGRR